MYAKINNNQIEYASYYYKTEEGAIIENFNNNVETMKIYGFKKVIDNIPSDTEKHHYVFDRYDETNDYIIVNYRQVENEIVNSEAIDDILRRLNDEVSEVKSINSSLLSANWDMEYRLCEIEWALGENVSTFSIERIILSKSKQAELIIKNKTYVRNVLESQIYNYYIRDYLSKEEYIYLMELIKIQEGEI